MKNNKNAKPYGSFYKNLRVILQKPTGHFTLLKNGESGGNAFIINILNEKKPVL